MRLIDADALEKKLEIADNCTKCPHRDGKCQNAFEVKEYTIGDICSLLGESPTVEPKKGRWIPTEYPFMAECEDCSVCGFRTAYGLNFNFCPECGADMRGKKE